MSRRIVARTRGQAFCRLRCGATDLILVESSGRQPGGGESGGAADLAPRPCAKTHRMHPPFRRLWFGVCQVCLFPADTGATNPRKALR
jgi:hypothetical protein